MCRPVYFSKGIKNKNKNKKNKYGTGYFRNKCQRFLLRVFAQAMRFISMRMLSVQSLDLLLRGSYLRF